VLSQRVSPDSGSVAWPALTQLCPSPLTTSLVLSFIPLKPALSRPRSDGGGHVEIIVAGRPSSRPEGPSSPDRETRTLDGVLGDVLVATGRPRGWTGVPHRPRRGDLEALVEETLCPTSCDHHQTVRLCRWSVPVAYLLFLADIPMRSGEVRPLRHVPGDATPVSGG